MDLPQREVEESMVWGDDIKELLEHMAAISRPNDGAPRVLIVFAEMATGGCDWLDGELRIELVDADDATVIECMTDLGGGFRERVFPPLVMKASIDEFRRATSVPEMIAPLVVKTVRDRRIVLVAERVAEMPSMVAPAVQIGKDNLFDPASSGRLKAREAKPEERCLSSGSLRAAKPVAVPQAGRVPDFGVDHAEAVIEDAPASASRGAMQAAMLDRRGTSDAEPPASATRTLRPSGLGAPPPPPIVASKSRRSAPPPAAPSATKTGEARAPSTAPKARGRADRPRRHDPRSD